MRARMRQLLAEMTTTVELAAVLKVSSSSLRKKVESGAIEGVKKGNTWLIDLYDFDKAVPLSFYDARAAKDTKSQKL